MPYYLDTTKLYRIWFSDNPTLFMNDENKLRFIQMRLKNPKATLSLVYSSACLSQQAITDLKEFCKKLAIQAVDFDIDVPKLLSEEQDKQIYALAKLEIEHTLKDTGGNLAAASDCARTLLPLVQHFGCYADFDVEVDFSKAPSVVKIYSPVVLTTAYHHHIIGDAGEAVPNNDFFAFAYDSSDLKQLHPQGVKDLRKLQKQILHNYHNTTPDTLYDYKPRFEGEDDPFSCVSISKCLLKKYVEINPNATLFDIRKFIGTLTIEFVKAHYKALPANFTADTVKTLQWQMYLNSVMNTSGPGALTAMFSEFLDVTYKAIEIEEAKPTFFSAKTRIVPQGKWRDYSNKCERYGYRCNNLHHFINSKQSDVNEYNKLMQENSPLEEDIGKLCDISWTKIGAQNQKNRSNRITQAAVTIQHAFRKHRQKKQLSVHTLAVSFNKMVIK